MTDNKPDGSIRRAFERAASFHPNFFPAEIGLDAQKYHNGEESRYAGVNFFVEQGWIHGVHARVMPVAGGGVTIAIDHWVHRPDGQNITTRFMELEAVLETDPDEGSFVVIKKARLQGEEQNVADRKTLDNVVRTCQQIMTQLRLEHSMPLLNNIAEKNGLKTKPLPSTYKDGNARFAFEAGKKTTRKFLRVPEEFLMALTGFHEQGQAARPNVPVVFNATQRDPDAPGKEYALCSQMMKGAGEESTAFSLRLKSSQQVPGEEPYSIHRVSQFVFKPCTEPENKGFVQLSHAEIDGRQLPLSDHRTAVRALNFLRDSTLQTQAGIMPDMAEILNYTNLQRAVSGVTPLSRKDRQRYTYRVLGGNPSGARLFKQDDGIGANSFLHLYEWYDEKNKYNTQAIMVDCGITPLSRSGTGFDGMMSYAGEYFEHRFNKKHKPLYKVDALVITHHHIDHFLGLPHLLLAGYKVDHVVCNHATQLYIEDACRALDVPKDFMPAKWTVVSDDMDLTVGKFNLSFGSISHSAITNWVNVKTPEGSTLHLSDSKVDPTVQSHAPANIERIAAQKPTMTIVDSTHAHEEEETRSEKELEDEIVEFMNENPDKGVIAFHISSNAARMATMVNAYGRTGRNTVVLGRAKQFLKQVLDRVGLRNGMGIKDYARTQYGVDVVNYTPNAKGARAIINGPLEKQGLLGTGTHNEIMSIANRLIENKDQKNLGFITPDKYVVVLSQSAIGGTNKKWDKMIEWLERRGFEYRVVHASGHEGKKGIRKMLDWAKAPYAVTTHGNKKQRANAETVIREHGVNPINPAEQDVIQVSDKKGCKIIAQEPSMMVYFSIKRPSDQHFGGGEDVEYYPYGVRPEIRSAVGHIMREISRIKREDMRAVNHNEHHFNIMLGKDPVLNSESTALKPYQKRVNISLPDYLVQNGILRRIIYDCETTQLGSYAWITQFAAKQSDWGAEGNTKYMDIRQTLPEKILPDLEALLATGIKPSDLYKTGPNYFAPRRFYHEVSKFLQESRQFKKDGETITKIWIDQAQIPQDPSSSKDGDSYMRRTIDLAFEKSAAFKAPRSVNTKTLLGGYNNKRADDRWLAHAAFRAGSLRYAPANTGGMQSFDLRNIARMFAYLRPDKFKVQRKPDNPNFLDFTVEGIMKANKLGYNKDKAHHADFDVEMEEEILKLMLSIDPELFTQAMLNANTTEVKEFLAGTHNGMLYPRSLVTYINTAAVGARANIGVYVGRSTDPRHRNKALIFNVSDFDPKTFEGMTAQQFTAIMRDKNHKLNKAFEVVNINGHPLLASADRGFAVGANRGTSIEAMKGFKHFIERNPTLAAEMIKGMESANIHYDADPDRPLEERIYAPAFMDAMSAHDKELAKIFEPYDEQEFKDAGFADELNRRRAQALDKFHSLQVRERYAAVLFQIEKEYKQTFGKARQYLHADDRDRERAKEKARINGLIDTDAVSIGRLESQIRKARKNWDKRMEGKTPEEKALAADILKESELLVQDIKTKLANKDPEWALTQRDYELLGLDDNKPYGSYKPPLSKNKVKPRPPKPPMAAPG